ncbi:MAG: lysophospholipid acyltransferase family protein [Legionellaceae bacterium]|nr:lysophospholipid acyltransferase family protein [Legionellaceae bacterium]
MEQLPVSLAGRFVHKFLPYRRSVVMDNINQVFKDSITDKQKTRLAQSFYSHLATSIKEMIQLRFISEKKLCSRVDVVGHEYLLDIAKQNKGVLILTGHFGSWEFAPLGGMLNFKQYSGQFHFIRKNLGNKTIEKILFHRYFKAGLRIIPKQYAMQKVNDALNDNHAVVFVLDQHATLKNKDGVAVEFFGKKAGTYRSLASISRYTGIPVVPAAGYRLPNGRHVLEFYEPIKWQELATSQESIYQNTLAYNQALEKIILKHPEQWMWLHKRWKLKS